MELPTIHLDGGGEGGRPGDPEAPARPTPSGGPGTRSSTAASAPGDGISEAGTTSHGASSVPSDRPRGFTEDSSRSTDRDRFLAGRAEEGAGAGAGGAGGGGDGGYDDDDEEGMGTVEPMEVAYTADHLAAVMKPVALTMMLASWVVANIHEPSQDAAIAEGLSVYMVFDEEPGEETGTLVGQSIVNAIVIVLAICLVTFVLVACYKYRCIKCMIGYLIFASASLLGYSGGFVVMTAFAVYNVVVSWPTFVFLMYNFAVVGVVAVFWQKGVPRMLTQGYLVAVSCIMAWIVVKLPEWTSWALLVALALYDLCAVLTPCGPLRALVKLAQERPEQPIPGLLYEADVGGGDRDGVRDTFASGHGATQRRTNNNSESRSGRAKRDQRRHPEPAPSPGTMPAPPHAIMTASQGSLVGETAPVAEDADPTLGLVVSAVSDDDDARAGVSAASADEETVARLHSIPSPPRKGSHSLHAADSPQPDASGADSDPARRAMISEREARGGSPSDKRRRTASSSSLHPRGSVAAGDSYIALPEGIDGQDEEEDEGGRSIKLGLGDFVFYSVLVSRAALFGFATFAACFVAVIMGLVGTLLLLGIFKKALPALPISIALGVTFYFTTRLLLFPMIVQLSTSGVSV